MKSKARQFLKAIFDPIPLDDNFNDYNEYWKGMGFRAQSLGRAKIISKNIKPNMRILDIGCGDGTLIDYLSKNNNPKEIMGIDISKNAVNITMKMGYQAYEIDILSEGFKLFLKDKYFDYIIITEVLEHIQDPENVVVTIKNHFDKYLFISIPNSGYILHRIRLLFGRFPVVTIVRHIKEHIRFWTMKDFYHWCNHFGLKVEKRYVSSSIRYKPIKVLKSISPSLLAQQIIYKISKIN